VESQHHHNYQSFGQCDLAAPDFSAVVTIGSQAPQFTLRGLDGKRVPLSDFIGKKHVL